MHHFKDKKIYVIGHIHPDTDSIVSAIAYAHLLRQRHHHHVLAARAGELNPETKFVLKYWKVNSPTKITNASGKNLILVDHNEIELAIKNIREANILEIIDHHRIGNVETIHPIPFENEPRGATSTIIAERYNWFRISFSKKMAGLILSAILSDTLLLKSPTTTPKDRALVRKLAKIAQVDIQKYGKQILEAGCDLINHTVKKIVLSDFKTYSNKGKKVGIGQVPVIGFEKALKKKKELLQELIAIKKRNYLATFLMITDILSTNSYLLFSGEEEKVSKLFNKKIEKIEGLEGGIIFLPKVVSRKKQVQPKIIKLIN